jgi:hypothetical protein
VPLPGSGLPAGPADSRELLDQLEAVSGVELVPIFKEWVFDRDTVELLPDRDRARAAHAELLALAGDWGSPGPVRLALAGWRFGDAMAAIAEATDWLVDRDLLLDQIEGAGLVPPQRLRDEFQTGGGSQAARRELEAEAAVVATYVEAAALSSGERTIVEQVGLLGGEDPGAALSEARILFGEGDLIGAAELSGDARDRLDRAGQDGLVRLASAVVVVVALVVLALSLARRRSRADVARYTARP